MVLSHVLILPWLKLGSGQANHDLAWHPEPDLSRTVKKIVIFQYISDEIFHQKIEKIIYQIISKIYKKYSNPYWIFFQY